MERKHKSTEILEKAGKIWMHFGQQKCYPNKGYKWYEQV